MPSIDPTPAQLEDFAARAATMTGPIRMVNLLRFRDVAVRGRSVQAGYRSAAPPEIHQICCFVRGLREAPVGPLSCRCQIGLLGFLNVAVRGRSFQAGYRTPPPRKPFKFAAF